MLSLACIQVAAEYVLAVFNEVLIGMFIEFVKALWIWAEIYGKSFWTWELCLEEMFAGCVWVLKLGKYNEGMCGEGSMRLAFGGKA